MKDWPIEGDTDRAGVWFYVEAALVGIAVSASYAAAVIWLWDWL